MSAHGFKCRNLAVLRWLAPLLSVLLAVVVALAFFVSVQLWHAGGSATVTKDQTRMELQP